MARLVRTGNGNDSVGKGEAQMGYDAGGIDDLDDVADELADNLESEDAVED